MYKKLLILAFVSIVSISGLNSCSDDNTTTPEANEFIANDNTFMNFMNWTLVKTNQGADPALGTAHAGNDETVTREIYIKNNQSRKDGKFPLGTIVVKHSKNTAGTVNEFTAMVKRGNDFNANGGNWEWFMLNPDGTIAEQEGMPTRGANLMNGMCVGCHSAASADDFVFTK